MTDTILAAEIDVSTRKYEASMSKAEGQAKRFDRALKALPDKIPVEVDASGIDRATSEVKELDGSKAKVSVSVDDSEVSRAAEETRGLFSNIQLTLDVSSAISAIQQLPAMIANTPVLSDIGDQRAAMRAFALGTGQTLEDVEYIGSVIDSVWADGLATSRTQIAGVAAELDGVINLRTPEGVNALRDAFVIAAASGQEVTDIVRAQRTLVENGLAPSYQVAADVLAGGFARGLNTADDLLDTVNEYSRDFADLGLTAEQFFGILESGLKGGAFNTDKIADAFRELKIRMNTALAARSGSEVDGLKALGLWDEAQAYEAGKITGEEWVKAVLATVEGGNFDALVTSTFGSPLEDLGTQVFAEINAAFGNPALIATFSGTTSRARSVLQQDLTTAFNRAGIAISNDLASNLLVAGKPLNDLIDSLPEKLNQFADLVQSGVGIPEALSIVLEAPELAAQIREFQGSIGGFIIELQLALASALEFFGNQQAASELRESAKLGAQNQLVFDLRFSDEADDIERAIKNATRRGVEESELDELFRKAAMEIVEGGGDIAAFSRNTLAAEQAGLQTQGIVIPNDPFSQAALGHLPKEILDMGNTVEEGRFSNIASEVFADAIRAEEAELEEEAQAFVENALINGWEAAVDAIKELPMGELQQRAAQLLVQAWNDTNRERFGGTLDATFEEFFGMAEKENLDQYVKSLETVYGNLDGILFLYRQSSLEMEEGARWRQAASTAEWVSDSIETNFVSSFDATAAGAEAAGNDIIATLGEVERTARVTQSALFDAGINPTAYAAMIFNWANTGVLTTNNTNISVTQNLNASSTSQAGSAAMQFSNAIRGFQ